MNPPPPKAFCGIGSRKTPPDILDLLQRACHRLVSDGWTCRSGGAAGADTACEQGALAALSTGSSGAFEVFLPWPSFGRTSTFYDQPGVTCLAYPHPGATVIAELHHPAWAACSSAARALHARNVHQVLGPNLASPSAFVLCWTPDAADGYTRPVTAATGGTGQAIRIAVARHLGVRNLADPATRQALLDWLQPSG